eukprot:COSAG04_NODE_45_length_31617_cov_47.863284_22_plen_448_part_01
MAAAWLLLVLLPGSARATPSQTNCTDARGERGPCGPGREMCGAPFRRQHPPTALPRFHLFDPSCALNDPSGPVFDPVHGYYHVFYQKHVAAPEPGAAPGASQSDGPVWGHWASKDLVSWAQLPVAIWNTEPYDQVAIYTGSSTVVDGKVVIVYPGLCPHGKDQCPNPACAGGSEKSWSSSPHDCPSKTLAIATPTDYAADPLLQNWSKPADNPVVFGSTRDPSTAWRTAAGEWRFTTFSGHVYRSPDFRRWSSSNDSIFGAAECPSLFPLPRDIRGNGTVAGSRPTHVRKASGWYCMVDGQHAKCPHKDWFQLGTYSDGAPNTSGGLWAVTPGVSFAPQIVDNGFVYASKDMATKDGRRVLFGWAGSTPPGMTVPRELLFDSSLLGGRILQAPVAELEQLRVQPALGTLGPIQLAGSKPLFAATESAHWLDVTAVFERPSGSANLWVD